MPNRHALPIYINHPSALTQKFKQRKKMSNKQSFVFLNEVKPYKENWRVHVKVLHSWKSNTNFGESLECILTDQQVILRSLYIFLMLVSVELFIYMSYYLNDY